MGADREESGVMEKSRRWRWASPLARHAGHRVRLRRPEHGACAGSASTRYRRSHCGLPAAPGMSAPTYPAGRGSLCRISASACLTSFRCVQLRHLLKREGGFGELFPSGQSCKHSQIRSAWRRATAQSRRGDLQRPLRILEQEARLTCNERSSRRIHLQDAARDAEQTGLQTWCPTISGTLIAGGLVRNRAGPGASRRSANPSNQVLIPHPVHRMTVVQPSEHRTRERLPVQSERS